MDTSHSEHLFTFSKILIAAKEFNSIVKKELPCFTNLAEGFGPYLKFKDGSTKIDLSDNILNEPLGYNFPAFLKIKLQTDQSLQLTNDQEKIVEIRLKLQLLLGHQTDIYFTKAKINSPLSALSALGLTEGEDPYFGLYLSKVSSGNEMISFSNALLYLAFVKFITASTFFTNPDFGINKTINFLTSVIPQDWKVNNLCFRLPHLDADMINKLNTLGIYLNNEFMHIPLSLNLQEAEYIIESLKRVKCL